MKARLILLFVTALGAAACRGASPGASATSPPPQSDARPASAERRLPEVVVAEPSRDPLRTSIEAPGTLVPFDEATIATEASGSVVAVHVEEGARIGRGELLVRLDPTKAELGVKQAQAALAQAQANFAKAHSEIGRKQQLLEDRTIAPGVFETFKAQHDGAAAAVDAAEAALALARRHLEEMTISAPLAGVVKEKHISVGEYVREGDPLVVLMRVDPIKLQFELPEKYAGQIADGQPVAATVAALPGQTVNATVRTIFPAVAVQSRTVRVEAHAPNAGYHLKPGFFASVRVPLQSRSGSVVVPRSALVRREGTENVFVLKGDVVDLARVEIGAESIDQIEIVTGLSAGDRVVIAGHETLKSGDRVRVRG